MKKYFIHNGSEQLGPFDLEELKTLSITKETPIWYDGLGDWTTASEIDALNELIGAASPPVFKDATNKMPPPVSGPAASNDTNDAQPNKVKRTSMAIVKGLIIGVLIVGGIFIFRMLGSDGGAAVGVDGFRQETYKEKVMTVAEIERSQPTKFLSATGQYRTTLLGNKIKVDCTITNKATVATYKDAIVRVTYYSKTKTVLGTNDYTIYEVFPPTSSKTVRLKIDNYKNVATIGWDVIMASNN